MVTLLFPMALLSAQVCWLVHSLFVGPLRHAVDVTGNLIDF